MPRQRSKKLSEKRKVLQQATPPAQDERDQDDNGGVTLDTMEKDEEELELDRLVLGDQTEFMAYMGHIEPEDMGKVSEKADSEANFDLGDIENFEDVDDAELFFFDGAPSTLNENILVHKSRPDARQSESEDEAAWDDSDDDRLMVSLAENPRRRKLRISEAENMVSGREYTRRLRQQFQQLNPVPEWALSSPRPLKRRRSSASSSSSISSNDMDIDGDRSTLPLARLLQSTSSLARAPAMKRAKLRPEILDIQRTRDIPMTQPSTVSSLSFHPQYPIILSSGPASTLFLHHILPTAIPTPNPLLTSVHISSTPLYTSAFLPPNGDKIFFSGRRRYFHTWDLESGTIQKVTQVYGHNEEHRSMERFKLSPCGRYMGLVSPAKKGGGIINILNASTSQWIASARIEGRGGVADFAWWRDGEGLTVVGKGGEVGEWSMASRSFLAIWREEGGVGATVLTLGGCSGRTELGGDRWVVIGSSSGIVNIYDRRPWVEKGINIPSRPEPTKRLMQLITATSCLEITPDGQLLVIASRWKSDALRLIHLPSCTVYKNWPTSQTPLGRVSAVAFSSTSDMLAVGNEQGKIRLWEIRA